MVDLRIIYIHGVDEVRKPRRPAEGRVYLFLDFTINRDLYEVSSLAILYTRFKLLDRLVQSYISVSHKY